MLALSQLPGVGRCLEASSPSPAADAAAAAVAAAARAAGVPDPALRRLQVLAAAGAVLPPSAAKAHGEELMGRHHTEALLPGIDKQVRRRAM